MAELLRPASSVASRTNMLLVIAGLLTGLMGGGRDAAAAQNERGLSPGLELLCNEAGYRCAPIPATV